MLLLCYGMIVFQPTIVTIMITQKHSYQKIKYYESYHTSKNNYHFRNNPISHQSSLNGNKNSHNISLSNSRLFLLFSLYFTPLRLLPNVLLLRVIQPFWLSVNVCRKLPFLFQDHEYVRLFLPPSELLVVLVIRVPFDDCVVVLRVVSPVFFVLRL